MTYQRKTKDIYKVIWKREEIDSFDPLKEEKQMRKEYVLVFHDGCVYIKKGRERIGD